MAGFRHRRSPEQGGRTDLSYYDGRSLLGFVRERDGACLAYTADERRLGTFKNRREACEAIRLAAEARTAPPAPGRVS